MGRDTTAGKRMAAKRSREKAAGLRRLNVAVRPEVLDRLTGLMTRHNCSSQAGVIELLVMAECAASVACSAKEPCNAVTPAITEAEFKTSSEKQQRKTAPAKSPKGETGLVTALKKTSPTQMTLF